MNILLIIIFCLTAIAVILTVSNLFYIVSVSVKSNELEQEINKKAMEFDNLKKERSSVPHPEQPISTEQIPEQNYQEPSSLSEDPIQIMRNVGGSFEEADKPSHLKHTQPEMVNSNNDFYPAVNPNEQLMSNSNGLDVIPVINNYSTPEYETDILATVNETESAEDHYIILQLYSESAKDADFESLWKKVSVLLQSVDTSDIGIDFTGINFLYNKEINWLIKIYQITSNLNKRIHLLNCDEELVSILSNNMQLKPLIQKT